MQLSFGLGTFGNFGTAIAAFLQAWRGGPTGSEELLRQTRFANLRMNYEGLYTPYDPVTRMPVKDALGRMLYVPIKYNFNRPIAHLAASFLAKNQLNFTIDNQPTQEGPVYDLWRGSALQTTFREAALIAAVESECYLKWVPVQNGPPQCRVIAPNLVSPRFDAHDFRKLTSAVISYPVETQDRGQIIYKEIHTPGKMEVWYGEERSAKESLEWDGDYMLVLRAANQFYPGNPLPISDIEPTLPLVQEYSWIADKFRRIVDMHANPNRVIIGVGPEQGKDAASEQIDNRLGTAYYLRNPAAKMEYLQWNGDVPAVGEHLDRTLRAISIGSQTPAIALADNIDTGQLESGVALRILFAPLVEKTEDKRVNWSDTLREMIRVGFLIQGMEPGPYVDFVWTDPTPENEQWLANIMAERVSVGTISRTSAMEALGVKDTEAEWQKVLAENQSWADASTPPMPAVPANGNGSNNDSSQTAGLRAAYAAKSQARKQAA